MIRNIFFVVLICLLAGSNLFSRSFIITSNPHYISFDTIRYSGFIEKLNLVYLAAELVNESGQVVIRQKIKSGNGWFSGQVALNRSLLSGIYLLRIYPAGFYTGSDLCIFSSVMIFNEDDISDNSWKEKLLAPRGIPVPVKLNGPGMTDRDYSLQFFMADENNRIQVGDITSRDENDEEIYSGPCNEHGIFKMNILPGRGNRLIFQPKNTGKNIPITLSYPEWETASRHGPAFNSDATNILDIQTDKSEYETGEKVKLGIYPNGKEAGKRISKIVISVNEAGQSFPGFSLLFINPEKEMGIENQNKLTGFEQELPGLNGTYLNPETGKPRTNYTVTLTRYGKTAEFQTRSVDINGRFTFNTDGWPENSVFYVSTVEQSSYGITITDDYFRNLGCQVYHLLSDSPESPLENFVRDARIRRVLINQLQEKNNKPVVMTHALYDTTRVYPVPDISYDLSEYIQFKDMAEVIREIMPYVHVIRENGKDRITIYNSTNPTLNGNPLFLINGMPTRRSEVILGLDISKIQVIDVLYKQKTLKPFGLIGFGGIMAIYMSAPVQLPNVVAGKYTGFHAPDPLDGISPSRDLPDLSPVIYWKLSEMDEHNPLETSFLLNEVATGWVIKTYAQVIDGNVYYSEKEINIRAKEDKR